MSEKDSWTVTEVAELFQTNRDKVLYRVRKLPNDYTYKKDNVIYVKKEGITALTEFFEKKTNGKTTEKLTELYEKELQTKNEQIAELQTIITQTQKLLDQQQQLHSQANQRIETLEKEIALSAPKTSPEAFYPEKDGIYEKQIKTPEIEREAPLMNDEQKNILAYLKENYQVETLADIEQLEMPDKKWWQFWKR